jgi:chloride channel protein, CIC family
VKPALAGLGVGMIGMWLPEVLGAGYGPVDGALHGRYTWQILIAIGLVKMLATTACFSAGVPGGMFAPTLFIGAMVGGGLGGLAAPLLAHAHQSRQRLRAGGHGRVLRRGLPRADDVGLHGV